MTGKSTRAISPKRERLVEYLRPWSGPEVVSDIEPEGVSGGQATEGCVGTPGSGWIVDAWPQLFPRVPAWTARCPDREPQP
jgi:hypothetical protein